MLTDGGGWQGTATGYSGATKKDACLSPVFRNGCPDPAADNYDPRTTSGIELGGWCQGQYQTGKNCLWDTSTDNYASVSFNNQTLWCCACVFGLYTE